MDGRSVVQYSRFDGRNWSSPIDIYATQPGGAQDRLSAAVGLNGDLHLIWTQGGGFRTRPIFYSYAQGQEALSAQHWSKPIRIDVEAHLISLQVDNEGVIHIVYTNFYQQPGVFYLRSSDQGFSWSEPVKLDPDINPGYAPDSMRFELDESGGLHVVWFYTLIEGGEWDLVQYAHLLDGDDTWSPPITIDQDDESGRFRGAVDPVIVTQGQSIHVLWAAGVQNYRNYRFSSDMGRTWSDSVRVFGELNGQAGDSLSVDSAGRVHFFGQIRYPQGVYHAYLESGNWSEPSLIYLIRFNSQDEIEGRIHAHSVVST
ncbi:MAG: sialidase family protein, partial [Anaerolineales bacterium]